MSINTTHNRGKVNNVIYNDRCGYAIIFYDPIYDLDAKIPPLRMSDLPYTIPIQRKSIACLKPAGKPVASIEVKREYKRPGDYEAAQDFIRRKIIERKMDEIREACANIRQCYKKAEKFDMKRREAISPRVKSKLRGKSSDEICDILVDDVMQNVDYVYERNLEEQGKTQKKLAVAALRRAAKAPKAIEKFHVKGTELDAVKEEENVHIENENIDKKDDDVKELTKALINRCEKKLHESSFDRSFHPNPPRCGLQNYSALKRRHLEVMCQRASDALLFEVTYGRTLRRMKNEIRRLRETYS
ncbi:CLUMA_CG016570, isoform A [Clunio marinus]|uniref:CLUMA_CG016570, isoform A n=1 Tax=Clunio marinus TaxID=568069 RepID=A0A1J1ISR1_9DIPT|nr:CLUMA_CG016570, isoform A [Clunio marinus]